MYPIIDTAKLADVQNVASKLASLPEKALLYIAGYAEGVRDATSTSGPPGQVEQDSAWVGTAQGKVLTSAALCRWRGSYKRFWLQRHYAADVAATNAFDLSDIVSLRLLPTDSVSYIWRQAHNAFDVVPGAQTKAVHEKAVQRAVGREVKEVPGKLYTDIAEKRKILRELYGGMMDTKALCKELGGMDRHTVKEWARTQGIGVQIGKRIKYDTDEVAKVIVMGRGMHA